LSQEQIAGKATKADIDTAISNIKFPAGISKEDVSTIVQDAFTKNPGLSKVDVQGVVDAAIAKLPSVPTIADITAAFTETTKTFATKADIDTAISNIKFPAGITSADVTAAITDYMTKNPGLTLEQVATKITDATAGLATTEAVKTAIGDALKGYATTADINTAIANIKFPPGISKEDVTTIVKQAFTDNPGLTKADVQGVVDAAIAKLPTAPTLEQIRAEINTATTTFATKAEIDTAIANIKFPPGLSKEDVTAAITDYMTTNPGLSAADVTKAITDYMTVNPPLNKEDVTKIVADAGKLIKDSLATTEKTILAAVAKNEAAGLKRDEALQ
jgi:hypothetical protein